MIVSGFIVIGCTQAATLDISAQWSEVIDSKDLVGGVGTDFFPSIDSEQVALNVGDTDLNPWTVVVHHAGANLPNGVSLAVKRTSSGSCGNLSGTLDYLVVSDQEQEIFTGLGDCTNIGLQLRLQGLSLTHGSGTYGATVIYTIQ
jgi:hypothetical protein